jgi:hypothetical protein
MPPQSKTAYEEKWPEFFVEWGRKKIAEWERHLEDKSLPLLDQQKLKSDISYLSRAIDRIGRESK